MSEARSVATVRIQGRSYRIGGMHADQAQDLAQVVDEAISAVADGGAAQNPYDQALLAALLLAGQLAAERAGHAGLRSEVAECVGRMLQGVNTSLTD